MSGKVVNLRQARKASVRAQKARAGDEKAALHGRSNAQKASEARDLARARAMLDGHQRDE